ncbi:hypothetical protein ZOSMA_22G00230 [Zostera marina]|uniref:Uncharacterized protein n=1 Tax=Zostera marina TaxID=29655 RepID=A0A0K9PI52_ZOSMR|nr:hypothetical protein ZOSMA_22G00230 [Zostera marina]
MEKETINLVNKIVERYMKYGAAKALKLSRKAVVDHQKCHILHRLHAMLLIKNDPSDYDNAMKHSYSAVRFCPESLEYRYFYQLLNHNKNIDKLQVLESSVAIWILEDMIEIENPMEPYCWNLIKQVINEEASGIESGKAAVEYIKAGLLKLINAYYRKIDSLPFPDEYFADVFSSSLSEDDAYQMLKVKTKCMEILIKNEYSCCGFMQRMFSEVCFQYGIRIKEEDEWDDKDKVLDLALASAKVASRVFSLSKEYRINMFVRILQCNKNLSVVEIQNMKDELRDIHSCRNYEPYCEFLIQEDVTLLEYYNNCINLILFFIQTLEERMEDEDDQKFISMYYKHLNANDLLGFTEKSIFFKRNIQYLLDNIPKLKKNVDVDAKMNEPTKINSELMKMIIEIVEKKPFKALMLTQAVVESYQPLSSPPAILLRLHSKYIFENDHNDIESALKFAKMAVVACPNSLDHMFFHASLMYHKAFMASPNDKMLYWMTVFECEKALMLEHVAEADEFNIKVIKLIDKKTNRLESTKEITEYLKTNLRTLINMCYRDIDELPKFFLATILSNIIPSSRKMMWTLKMFENPKYRFCSFLFRVYSDICHTFALKSLDSKDGRSNDWFKLSYVSATIANRNFYSSKEYGINNITRNLQVLKNFYIEDALIAFKDLSSVINIKNNQEPYYEYMIVDNEYKDHEQQNEYFNNCASLLIFYRMSLEQEYLNGDNIEFCRKEVFYKRLEEVGLTDFPKKAPGFFANIMYLLENPMTKLESEISYKIYNDYEMMGLGNGNDIVENEEQKSIEEKKNGGKNKAKKKNASRKK